MARYERVLRKGTSDRKGINPFTKEPTVFRGQPRVVSYWEDGVVGPRTVMRYGVVGRSESVTSRPFDFHAHRALIASREASGYGLVDAATVPTVDSILVDDARETMLRSLDEDPDDPRRFLVYGDWLQERGDPRGELIAMATSDAPAFVEAHREHLLGPVAKLTSEENSPAARFDLAWELGFVRSARIPMSASNASDASLAKLLQLESGRFLRELSLLHVHEEGSLDSDSLVEPHLDALLFEGPRHAIHTLRIGDWALADDEGEGLFTLGDCRLLWTALPALRRLSLRGEHVELGDVRAPMLETLELWNEAAEAIEAFSTVTSLRSVSLMSPDSPLYDSPPAAWIDRLSGSPMLEALEHLTIDGVASAGETTRAIAESWRAPRLLRLVVRSPYRSQGIRPAREHYLKAFPALRELHID